MNGGSDGTREAFSALEMTRFAQNLSFLVQNPVERGFGQLRWFGDPPTEGPERAFPTRVLTRSGPTQNKKPKARGRAACREMEKISKIRSQIYDRR